MEDPLHWLPPSQTCYFQPEVSQSDGTTSVLASALLSRLADPAEPSPAAAALAFLTVQAAKQGPGWTRTALGPLLAWLAHPTCVRATRDSRAPTTPRIAAQTLMAAQARTQLSSIAQLPPSLQGVQIHAPSEPQRIQTHPEPCDSHHEASGSSTWRLALAPRCLTLPYPLSAHLRQLLIGIAQCRILFSNMDEQDRRVLQQLTEALARADCSGACGENGGARDRARRAAAAAAVCGSSGGGGESWTLSHQAGGGGGSSLGHVGTWVAAAMRASKHRYRPNREIERPPQNIDIVVRQGVSDVMPGRQLVGGVVDRTLEVEEAAADRRHGVGGGGGEEWWMGNVDGGGGDGTIESGWWWIPEEEGTAYGEKHPIPQHGPMATSTITDPTAAAAAAAREGAVEGVDMGGWGGAAACKSAVARKDGKGDDVTAPGGGSGGGRGQEVGGGGGIKRQWRELEAESDPGLGAVSAGCGQPEGPHSHSYKEGGRGLDGAKRTAGVMMAVGDSAGTVLAASLQQLRTALRGGDGDDEEGRTALPPSAAERPLPPPPGQQGLATAGLGGQGAGRGARTRQEVEAEVLRLLQDLVATASAAAGDTDTAAPPAPSSSSETTGQQQRLEALLEQCAATDATAAGQHDDNVPGEHQPPMPPDAVRHVVRQLLTAQLSGSAARVLLRLAAAPAVHQVERVAPRPLLEALQAAAAVHPRPLTEVVLVPVASTVPLSSGRVQLLLKTSGGGGGGGGALPQALQEAVLRSACSACTAWDETHIALVSGMLEAGKGELGQDTLAAVCGALVAAPRFQPRLASSLPLSKLLLLLLTRHGAALGRGQLRELQEAAAGTRTFLSKSCLGKVQQLLAATAGGE